MSKSLNEQEVEQYKQDGYVCPIDVLSPDQVATYRRRFEAYEQKHNGWYELSKGQKLYLLQT